MWNGYNFERVETKSERCYYKFTGIMLRRKWVKRFSEGRESVTDEERSGRPATRIIEENIAKVRQIVRENHRLSVRSIAEQVNIDRETVRKILTEGM
jgi:transposase